MSERDIVIIRLSALDERQTKFWDENYSRSSGSATKTVKRIINIAINEYIEEFNEIETTPLKIMDKKERISFRLSALDERQTKFWDENYSRSSGSATKTLKRIINIAMKSKKKRDEKTPKAEDIEKEVKRKVERGKKKQADILIELINEQMREIFRDDWGNLCVRIYGKKHYLDSSFVRDWMIGRYRDSEEAVPSDNALDTALSYYRYLFGKTEKEIKDEKDEKKQFRKINLSKLTDEEMKKSRVEAFAEMVENMLDSTDEDRNQASELAILIDEEGIKPFKDEDDFPCILIEGEKHKLDSSFVRDWMIGRYVERYRKAISNNAIDVVISFLKNETHVTDEEQRRFYEKYNENVRIQFKTMIQLLRDEKIEPFRDDDGFIYIWVEGVKRKFDSSFVKDWMKRLLWDNEKRLLFDETYIKIIDYIEYEVNIKEKAEKPKEGEEPKKDKKRRRIDAGTLLAIAIEAIDRHFTDELGIEYIMVNGKNIEIESKKATDWLESLGYIEKGVIPTEATVRQVKGVLRHKAREETYKLYNRVAPDGLDGGYIDIVDEENQTIHWNKEGYRITSPPILFRPYEGKLSLPIPEEGGNIDDLFDFINIKDDEDKLLVKAITIHYLIPEIDHICMYMYGGHGCGKSFGQWIIRSLIDPSEIEEMALKKNIDEIDLEFEKNYLVNYGNVSSINQEQSDRICLAVTGGSVMRRKLYTDNETVIRKFWRPFLINGRGMVAFSADFLDRFMIFHLSEISDDDRVIKEELIEKFNEKRGKLFGAMLDILVKASNIYLELKKEIGRLPRMSGAVLWLCAITEAQGIDYHLILNAYDRRMLEQHEKLIGSSIIGMSLINFIDVQPTVNGQPEWIGSIQDLFIGVKSQAKIQDENMRRFPRSAYSFSQKLSYLEISLRKVGYSIEIIRGGIKEIVKVRRIEELEAIKDLKREYSTDKRLKDDENKLDKYLKHVDETIEDSTKEEYGKLDSERVEGMKTFEVDIKKDKKKKTMAEELEIVHNVISECQVLTGVAKAETVFKILLECHEVDRVKAEKLIGILMRDGRIYEPRPRYYKTIEG